MSEMILQSTAVRPTTLTLAALAAGWLIAPRSFAANVAANYQTIYAFPGLSGGSGPEGGLTSDASMNLYGVTSVGGLVCSESPYEGCGTIFKLDSSGQTTTIFAFSGGASGVEPTNQLTVADGTLFGTAFGGVNNMGVIYSLNRDGSNFQIVHALGGSDGEYPNGQLQIAGNGGFFGVASQGGSPAPASRGTVFYVQPNGTFVVLHNFKKPAEGQYPNALLIDAQGNLFGSTYAGGGPCPHQYACGVVFEYAPSTRTYTVLYRFTGGDDGAVPTLGSIGPDGTLYGVTQAGAGAYRHGTLFSLAPGATGYSFSTLLAVRGHGEGDGPLAGPTLAKTGALFFPTESYIYRYQNGHGQPVIHNGGDTAAKLFIDNRDSTLYGLNVFGGIVPCLVIPGNTSVDGCGTIFSLSASPAN